MHILSWLLPNLICRKQTPGIPGEHEFQDSKGLHRNFLLGQACRCRQHETGLNVTGSSHNKAIPFRACCELARKAKTESPLAVIVYVIEIVYILSCVLPNLVCSKQKPGISGTHEFQDSKGLHRNFLLGQACRCRQHDNIACRPCPHQLWKCPCQSSIWWQVCSSEQLQNGFSLIFGTCSMSFQHMKTLVSACNAGTLACHWRSQIALETLLTNATGHSKE